VRKRVTSSSPSSRGCRVLWKHTNRRPRHVGLLGARTIATHPDGCADLIQEPGRPGLAVGISTIRNDGGWTHRGLCQRIIASDRREGIAEARAAPAVVSCSARVGKARPLSGPCDHRRSRDVAVASGRSDPGSWRSAARGAGLATHPAEQLYPGQTTRVSGASQRALDSAIKWGQDYVEQSRIQERAHAPGP
jgi:hypothetical protein